MANKRNNQAEKLNEYNAGLIGAHVKGFRIERSGDNRYNRPTYNLIKMGKVFLANLTTDECSHVMYGMVAVHPDMKSVKLATELPETKSETPGGNTTSKGKAGGTAEAVAAAAAAINTPKAPTSPVTENGKPAEGEGKQAAA